MYTLLDVEVNTECGSLSPTYTPRSVKSVHICMYLKGLSHEARINYKSCSYIDNIDEKNPKTIGCFVIIN
jgi:hypothetical protein